MPLSLIFIIFFSLIPLVVWGYGVTYLSADSWNRGRLLIGMLSGGLSVGLISLFHTGLLGSPLEKSGSLLIVFSLFFALVWILSRYGSAYVRVFLRKLALLHIALFLLIYLSTFVLSPYIADIAFALSIFVGVSSLLYSAFLEEGLKHLGVVGLAAHQFRFSRRDFLIFTLFVTLGFVCIENLIYLIRIIDAGPLVVLRTGFSRSIFSLLAHFFAASICVVWWWKALSYRAFSWQYIGLFFVGFASAVLAHTFFNFLIEANSLLGVVVFSAVAYVMTTKWMQS